jgi:hypothetical protein
VTLVARCNHHLRTDTTPSSDTPSHAPGLPTRALVPDPTPRHRSLHRIARHRRDQHPHRHLIRPRPHTLTHDRRPCQPHRRSSRCRSEPIKNYQVNNLIKLG